MTISIAQDISSCGDHSGDWLADAPTHIVRDEALYHRGDRKTHLYFIEAGTVALYETRVGGAPNVLEFVFAGDTVGLGYLTRHIQSAHAIGEVRVKYLPLAALDQVLRDDRRAKHRYSEALQREFEFRRDEVLRADRKPANRLAALFLALSRLNEQEGRDSNLIGDALECATVAGHLGFDLDTLGRALVELERAGLIKRFPPHGLQLVDFAGLARLADEGGIRDQRLPMLQSQFREAVSPPAH
jgi:CRP/FNR family transcriptional regulator